MNITSATTIRVRRPRGLPALTLTGVAALMLLGQPAFAAGLSVSATNGLVDGDSITVSGSGFTPDMTQIAVGQCIAEFNGPADCNLAGGAQFVNADSSGSFGPVTLKLAESFNGFDCTARSCVIAAQILPSSADADTVAANTTLTPISFAAPEPEPAPAAPVAAAPDPSPAAPAAAPAAPAAGASPAPAATNAPVATGSLASTGIGHGGPFLALSGGSMLLPGLGLLLLVPAVRRRREVQS